MRRALSGLVAVALLSTTASPQEPAVPSAAVLAVEGRATVRASPTGRDGGSPLLLDVLDPLTPGEHVEVASDGALWLLDGDGRPVALRGPGAWRVTVDGLRRVDRPGRQEQEQEQESPGVERLDLRLVPAGVEAEWRVQREDGARSALGDAAVLAPAETAVHTRRAVLEWRPRWGVARWDLGLWRLGEEGSLAPVERWTGLAGSAHAVWGDLEPGAFYLWEVSPAGGGRATGERAASAWFLVLSLEQERALDADLARLEALREARPDATAALAVMRLLLLERYGLLAEAEAGWRSLLLAEPERRRPIQRRLERLARRELVEPRERVRMSRSGLPALPMCREAGP